MSLNLHVKLIYNIWTYTITNNSAYIYRSTAWKDVAKNYRLIRIITMNTEKLNKAATKLEYKYMMDMSKNAKRILAMCQFYRIQQAWDDNWRNKLIALLTALECENIDELIKNGDAKDYERLGAEMTRITKAKLMRSVK